MRRIRAFSLCVVTLASMTGIARSSPYQSES
jgi:hypothetical protein